MEEGIRFAECLTPVEIEVDVFDQVAGAPADPSRTAGSRRASARGGPARRARTCCCRRARSWSPPAPSQTPCWRARTRRMSRSTAAISRPTTRTASPATPRARRQAGRRAVLISLGADGRAVSFFGDLHPSFAGNVVKAMGGAKQGYPVVSRMLARRAPAAPAPACSRRTRRRIAGAGPRRRAAHAEHRRGRRPGPRWPRAPSSRASSTGCRITRRCAARIDGTTLGDGRARPDRRVDRP